MIDSLHCAGAEKSLTTLLGLLDYQQYSVDVLLFAHGGEFESLVPKEVNILSPLAYTRFSNLRFSESVIQALKTTEFKMLKSRMKYSYKIRTKKRTIPQEARLYWENVSGVIEDNSKVYDIAISYAQGVPTFYVADKVKAIKKIAWVNTSYNLEMKEREFQKPFYDQFTNIITVSHSAKAIFLETYPFYSDKVEVIYDINNPDFIVERARSENSYEDEFDGIRILTIGRLDEGKGYDIALEACKKLKETGLNFRWYVLGKGPLKKEINGLIRRHDLLDHFILLGVEANPYPFIKDADIYVQTSRFEGFGLAIAEARMLNIPVVCTNFGAAANQMKHEKNGLVVEMNAESVKDSVLRLINDSQLNQRIVHYLQTEKKGNLEELDKIYRLIGANQ